MALLGTANNGAGNQGIVHELRAIHGGIVHSPGAADLPPEPNLPPPSGTGVLGILSSEFWSGWESGNEYTVGREAKIANVFSVNHFTA